MKVAIHQPQYLPWPTLIAKAIHADFFVFLDNVQYPARGFINRTVVTELPPHRHLTIPVSKAPRDTSIGEIKIADGDWVNRHIEFLRRNWPCRETLDYSQWGILSEILGSSSNVSSVAVESTLWLLSVLGVEVAHVKASELDARGRRVDLLLNICHELGADTYLSGLGARQYQVSKDFIKAGVGLEYLHPQPLPEFPAFLWGGQTCFRGISELSPSDVLAALTDGFTPQPPDDL